MLISIVTLVGVIAVTLGATGSLYVMGMRRQAPWAQKPVIWISRAVINPRQMRTAGSPGAYASVIHHQGRRSGRLYQTPVGAVPTEDGFVIALPYGTRVSWLRNVLAGQSASIVHEGQTYTVVEPEVIPMRAAERYFTPGDRRSHRIFGVEQCLHVRRVQPQLEGAA